MTAFPAIDDPARLRAFILEATAPARAPLVPEFELRLATEITPIWETTEAELQASGLPPPFWAFAWVGGQALARFVLDRPETARGRRVLSFACGGGVEALAAARAGAAEVVVNDVDPVALAAAEVNAAANGLSVSPLPGDLLDEAPGGGFDLVLAGDVFYERGVSERIADWLGGHARAGATVLIGDPGRTFLPRDRLEALAAYDAPATRALEDRDVMRTTVWRMGPA